MPHVILKRVWDYCAYSKKFLAFIFLLLFISSMLQKYILTVGDVYEIYVLQVLVAISVAGYGMVITRDRINHGKRLPKIEIKDIIVLGIKSVIVITIYLEVQGLILDFVCSPFNFPAFDLEEMLLLWPETIHMIYTHNPVNTIIFLVVGAVLFYVFSFFMEIGLAKLADTNSFLEAFNFPSIKRSIDVIGWRNYAKEYTLIILTIVLLSYLTAFQTSFTFVDSLIDMTLSFFIFATQFLGIGAVYCRIKDLENEENMPAE